MKIFVSGGTGFVGGYICRELLARGHTPRLLVHSTRASVGDGTGQHERSREPLADLLHQRERALDARVAAGAGSDRDQAIGALVDRLVREGVVDDVVQHDAAPAVHRVDHHRRRAQAGDDDRHLVLRADGDVFFQPVVAGDRVRAQFEKEVLADVPQQIDDQVQRLIDWLVQKDLQEWQRVMTYVQRRKALHAEHIVGEGIEPREIRRRELIDSMGKTVQRIVDTYDRDREAQELAAHVETAVAQTALLEVGAVGLGTIVSIAVLSSTLDITGVVAAGTLAVLGFFVIPFQRKRAKDAFKEKMVNLRTRLTSALTTEFHHESENAVARLKDGVAPYTRFVLSERERIDKTESTLASLREKISELRARSQVVVGK